MKFIHTSDWHLGKSIHETSLLEDQKYALESLIELIKIEKPNAVIIAGDIYDRAVPPKEAIDLFDDVIYEIVINMKIPILSIAGNHDSSQRLEYGSRIFSKENMYIEGKLKETSKVVSFLDEYGKINFYLSPFADVSEARSIYKNNDIKNYEDLYRSTLENIELNKSERNVFIGHGFITNFNEENLKCEDEISQSVRPLSIGTIEYVSADIFDDFDYVALGHLHKPQKVKREEVRYSGSLLKYSFSEVNQQKSVTVVEINDKNNVIVRKEQLKILREMKSIKGTIDQLISLGRENRSKNKNEIDESYIIASLEDEDVVYDAIGRLRAIYPNVLRIEYPNRIMSRRQGEDKDDELVSNRKNKSDMELFKDFYHDITGISCSKEKMDIAGEVFNDIEKEKRGK